MRKILLGLLFFASYCNAQYAGNYDPAFTPATLYSQTTSGNNGVRDMALQPDGKIIISAYYWQVVNPQFKLQRLNPNGSVDASFNPPTDIGLSLINLLPDGDILITGYNIPVGNAIKKMVRLNTDGSVDTGFNFPTNLDLYEVACVTVQPDGKILVAMTGEFSPDLVRLNPDGSYDSSFAIMNDPLVNQVRAIMVLPNGKIFVGGDIQHINPVTNLGHRQILRLNTDGTVDDTFDMGQGIGGNGSDTFVASLAMQPDGKILVGGRFSYYNDLQAPMIFRMDQDGNVDSSFASPISGEGYSIQAIYVRPNGNIMVGGEFYSTFRNSIAMLLPNGTFSSAMLVDPANTASSGINIENGGSGPDAGVKKIIEQPDNKILFCGFYGESSITHAQGITRLLGNNYYLMSGYTRLDSDSNGCSFSDIGFPHMKVKLVNGVNTSYFYSTPDGLHNVNLKNGTSVITPQLDNPSWFNVSPATLTLNMPSATNYYNQNFCVTAVGVHHDLEVSITSIGNAVPGQRVKYKIKVSNNGNQIESGTLTFNYDARSSLNDSSPIVSSAANGQLVWNMAPLNPMNSREYMVELELNRPDSNPALDANQTLVMDATVACTGDEIPSNNQAVLHQLTLYSYDPNDKTCLEGAAIALAQVGDYVHYLIRFENTGSWPAQNIIVTDLIDTAKYDIASLVPIDGSHPFITRVTTGNKVEFLFNNIFLGFTDADNKGYVAFKIKTKSSLQVGDTFENSASIYFDFNLPIVTNTATTAVQTVLGTASFVKESLGVYPVPAHDLLQLNNPQELKINAVSVYNLLGQFLFEQPYTPNSAIDISVLKQGSYLIELKGDHTAWTRKFIKL